MSDRSQAILLVDDDSNDRFLIQRAFKKIGIANPLVEVADGAEAIAYLSGDHPYADRDKYPYPAILLLDLQMPRVGGLEVLEWIRSNLVAPGFLIVVLSRTDEIRQVNRAYTLGANSFLTKPGNKEDIQAVITAFRDYWILTNQPPAPSESEDTAFVLRPPAI
jgi:CheY-like chemotaxis protein